jgi:N-ethylmaleimide reductase
MKLLQATQLGALSLSNRIIMAPMTRGRASTGDMPNHLMRDYYRQRASAGLIISEGVHPDENGKGYSGTPGIYNAQQIAAWAEITQAVHGEGGLMAMQLMHCGRIGHALNKAEGSRFLAPSAIAARAEIYTNEGMQAMPVPEAMSIADIRTTMASYQQAASNAFAAGFDAVELHCTSGYLPAQFLSTGSNQRSDKYGGSVQNRIRFVVELIDALIAVRGADRVGFRICPGNPFNDLFDENPEETFAALLQALESKGLAYVHAIHSPDKSIDVVKLIRENFSAPLIINDGYTPATAEKAVQQNVAEAVSFARHFIANPNLVHKIAHGQVITDFEHRYVYAGGARGYSDY